MLSKGHECLHESSTLTSAFMIVSERLHTSATAMLRKYMMMTLIESERLIVLE